MPFPLLPTLRLQLPAFYASPKTSAIHANDGDVRTEEPWPLTSLQEKLIKIGQG